MKREPSLTLGAIARATLIALGSCAAAGLSQAGLEGALTGGLLTGAFGILTNRHASKLDRDEAAAPVSADDLAPTDHLLGLASDTLRTLCEARATKAFGGSQERFVLDYATQHVRACWIEFTSENADDRSRVPDGLALTGTLANHVTSAELAHVLSLAVWQEFARMLLNQAGAPPAPAEISEDLGQLFYRDFTREFYGHAQRAACRDPVTYAALQLHFLGVLRAESRQHTVELQQQSRQLQEICDRLQQEAHSRVASFDDQKKLVLSKRLGQLRSDVLEMQEALAGLPEQIIQPILVGLQRELGKVIEGQKQIHGEVRNSRHTLRWIIVAVVAVGVGVATSWWQQNRQMHELRRRLEHRLRSDAPGSELLADFQVRCAPLGFSAQETDPGQRVSTALAELARERAMTVDELRQKMLQAAPGARERVELANQLRHASESEAARLKQIERDGYKDLAATALAGQRYAQALGYYQQALGLTSSADEAQEWASLQNNLGNALSDLAARSDGAVAARLLADAVAAYREAPKVRTREQVPQDWAQTQNNLGAALRDQAGHSTGGEAARLLTEAVAAFHEALQVQSRNHFPQDWAMTQNNLGIALWDQARLSERAEAMPLLTNAVAAFRAALEVSTREQSPQQWAATQNNLGNALHDQAARSEDAEARRFLADAVAAYHEALKVNTHEQSPQKWAMAQNNLGLALRDQAGLSEGQEATRLLGEAVAAHRAALTVYTRELFPQQWATAHYNLALALRDQAKQSKGAEAARSLGEAAAAYRDALKVFTREQFPQQWAAAQNNLGNALRDQAVRSEGAEAERLLQDAIKSFQNALEVWTADASLDYRGMASRNLAQAQEALRKLQR